MRMDTVKIEHSLWVVRIYNWNGTCISETRTSEERMIKEIEELYRRNYHVTVHHKGE